MWYMIGLWTFWVLVAVLVRVVPIVKRGRVVTLDHPGVCTRTDAEHALDRLVAAGIHAEIVHAPHTPAERYVIQVPRREAPAAESI